MKKLLFIVFLLGINLGFSQTFTNTTSVSIPDNDAITGAWTEILVSGLNPVSEVVSVQINLTHTYDQDLLIQLEYYDNTYTLSNQNGGSGDNYTATVFTNTATTNITAGTAPFTSSYIPENLLPTFVQSFNPNGTWRLHVYDLRNGDVGTIDSWSITFQAPPCPTVDYGTLPATMSCTDADTTLFVNDASTNGGWACPALFFEFNVDAAAESNLTDNIVTVYEDGNPIYSGTVNTDRLTVYSLGAFFSPSSNYTFTATDNDGTMTWLVYDENGTNYSGSFTNTTVTEGPWSPQGTSSWTCVPTNGITATGDWGAAIFDPSVVGAGSYTITYNWDNQGTAPRYCTGSASHTVTVTNPWDASWTSPGTVCDDGGSLNLNSYITGNTGGIWSGTGVSGSTFNPSGLSGNISVTYTVGSGATCQNIVSHDINVVPHPTANAGSDATICEGDNYTLSGSATNYTSVAWTSSGTGSFNNATALSTVYTPSISDIASGLVTLTLTANANSPCSNASNAMILTINPQPTVDAGSNDAICANETYTLSGSATNYNSITWTTSGNGSFDDASSLTAIYTPGSTDISTGFVTLTLTTNDPVGPCNSASSNMTLTINPLDDATFSYSSSTFCQSGTDPTPTNTTGGTFTSSPAGLVINASTGLINLSASTINTYDVTYSTSGACPDVSTIQVTITLAPSADFTYPQADYCSNETNPLPTFGSGASAGTFSVTPSGLFFVNTNTGEINLTATSPGTYTVTNDIPASGGCSAATHSETVSVYPAATVSAGQNDAICSYETYTLQGTMGGSATSITWTTSGDGTFNNSDSLTSIYTPGTTDITNGSVTLTITTNDPAGVCGPATDDMTLTIHQAPDLTASVTDVSDCNNPNGQIDLHTTGGTVPLNFSIDNGNNFFADSIFQNVNGGYYPAMVVDAYNCSDTLTVFVGAPATPDVDSTVVTDVLCAGDTTGSITIYSTTASQFSIDNGVTFQINNVFTGLSGGTYQIALQNAGGCISDTNLTLTINEPATLNLALTPTSPLCYGECDGQMDLTVTGGTTPYSISWSTGDNDVLSIDSLCDGTYNVTVIDVNGCQNSNFEQIVMPATINITTVVSDVACNGLNNGFITTYVTGGTNPYQYIWSNGSTSATDSLLSGGYYSLTVTDINNCQAFEDSILIIEPNSLILQFVNQYNPYCAGNDDGSITINATGGTSPYSYSWNTGATDTTISNLSSGTYSVTITDFHNCQTTLSTTLSGNNDISITGEATVDEHYQGNIDITVSGGDSLDVYTYLWSNQVTTEDLNGLGGGTYWVTVTDIHNCLATDSFTIEIPLIIPTIITPNGDGYNDTWRITNIDSYKNVHIEIYDRWGDMIFTFDGSGLEYKSSDKQWDGTFNGKILPFGSYVYIVSLNNDEETYNGIVTVKY